MSVREPEQVLRVGDKVVWKPGGQLLPFIREVSDIRANVNIFTGEGECLREISWRRLRTDGPATAVFLDGEMPTHGWLLDPVEPWPLDRRTPFEPGEIIVFPGESSFLPSGTRGVVEAVSQSGVEVSFENGYRFTMSADILMPASEYHRTHEPDL